jgi:hypothetical protein
VFVRVCPWLKLGLTDLTPGVGLVTIYVEILKDNHEEIFFIIISSAFIAAGV